MDWLFRPIGSFFKWTFGALESMSWPVDLALVAITCLLILYWFAQIWKHRKNDKGLFKKQS